MTKGGAFNRSRTSPGVIRRAEMPCVRLPLSLGLGDDVLDAPPGHGRGVLVARDTISEEDLALIQVVDTADEVLDALFAHYEERGFEPSPEEVRMMRNL